MLSINFLFLRSTTKPYLYKKSPPIMGRLTEATINSCTKFLRNPKSNFNNCDPYVFIVVPFAATKLLFGSFLSRGKFKNGTTDISAPVSMRKISCEFLHFIKRRRDLNGQLLAVLSAVHFIFLN